MTKHEALRAMLNGAKIKHAYGVAVAHFAVRNGDVTMRHDDPVRGEHTFRGWSEMPVDGYYTFTPPMTDDEIIRVFVGRAYHCADNPESAAARKAFEFCAKVLQDRSLNDE